jgi:branched-subunit amino acid transport protein
MEAEIGAEIVVLILGMALVTYIPRVLPMLTSDFQSLKFLKYIPIAIFASLVFPDLLLVDNQVAVNEKTFAGLLALIVAWKTRNILVTMVVGLLVLLIINRL